MVEPESTLAREIKGLKHVQNIMVGMVFGFLAAVISSIFYFGAKIDGIGSTIDARLNQLGDKVATAQTDLSHIKGRVELLPEIRERLQDHTETTPDGKLPRFAKFGPLSRDQLITAALYVGSRFRPAPHSLTHVTVENNMWAMGVPKNINVGYLPKEWGFKVNAKGSHVSFHGKSESFNVLAVELAKAAQDSKPYFRVETNDRRLTGLFKLIEDDLLKSPP